MSTNSNFRPDFRAIYGADPELSAFAETTWEANNESDRGCVLVYAALIEEELGKTLLAALPVRSSANELLSTNHNAPLGTFYAKELAAHALRLISDDERENISIIRKMRNDFAHKALHSFREDRAQSQCQRLTYGIANMVDDLRVTDAVSAKWRFHLVCSALALTLFGRRNYP